jgi:glycosyltransferase involved in cell wall biosynthesis
MLEAMACGVPVITSNTSSMPEVAGNAAVIIDPFKPEEISAAMITLYCDNDQRIELIRAGFIQAAKFSWRAMAQDVLNIYKEIAG